MEHLRAFVWLRWRLRINQVRKGGLANKIILAIMAFLGVVAALGIALAMFCVGFFLLGKVSPTVILFVWDGMVIACLFTWMTGLITELQRSESLALTKFLHLPVSATGVFLINYLSSFFSVNLLIFGPAMFALALGLTFSRGPLMLVQLLLVTGFFFMMTALTYQFQGWLASLMVNKRRRRTIIATVTVAFILLAQLPNLANLIGGPMARKKFDTGGELAKQTAELQAKVSSKEITIQEFERRHKELNDEFKERNRAAAQELYEKADQTARLASLILPIGWLPLGSMVLAEGSILAALLGMLGFSAIGGVSLWRSYKTTLRLYTGQFTSGKRPSLEQASSPTIAPEPKTIVLTGNPLERDIRGLSEQSTVIALSNFRALIRAPEAKMMLLSPLILVVVFGSIMFTRSADPPEQLRPLMASGGVAMILFTLSQLIGNQFGFDRNGFRVFVLCPAPRREILLGKNASAAPFVLTLSVLVVVFIQVVYPMPVDLFLSLLPQIVSMFLLYCLIGNLASILVPMRIAPGTMKPMNTRTLPILGHIGMMLLLPMILSVTVVPLLFQMALHNLGWLESVPIALPLAILECLVIAVFYYFAVGWEGDLLQAREQRILELVVTKEE